MNLTCEYFIWISKKQGVRPNDEIYVNPELVTMLQSLKKTISMLMLANVSEIL